MSILIVILISLIISSFIAYIWVRGIDNMKKNHPDYKGEDFLNWDGKDDNWDDNKIHSEGNF